MSNVKNLLRRSFRQLPIVKAWRINREFHTERALLRNLPMDVSDQGSVIHYSVNKAATQYTKRIMLACGKENGLLPVRMSDYAWVRDVPYLFELSELEIKHYHHLFRQRGYLYTVFGGLVEGVPDLQNYRTVVMLRDPRDVLV